MHHKLGDLDSILGSCTNPLIRHRVPATSGYHPAFYQLDAGRAIPRRQDAYTPFLNVQLLTLEWSLKKRRMFFLIQPWTLQVLIILGAFTRTLECIHLAELCVPQFCCHSVSSPSSVFPITAASCSLRSMIIAKRSMVIQRPNDRVTKVNGP